MTAPGASGPHLEVEQVVGYLENRLPAGERRRAAAHVAECAECAAELVAVSRLQRQPRRTTRWLGAAAAAAAVVAVALVGPRLASHSPEPPESPVRGSDAAGVSTVAPPDGGETRGVPELIWHAVPGASVYHVTVSRADGDSVWSATVRDTTVSPPATAVTAGPDPYYWYVDALLADGRSVSGRAREFRASP
jgi:putative zinc finger protein